MYHALICRVSSRTTIFGPTVVVAEKTIIKPMVIVAQRQPTGYTDDVAHAENSS
jgi:hypothetical protein